MVDIFRILTGEPRETKTPHNWVIFSNPRNGKIKITACHACGVMLPENSAAGVCSGASKKHPILNKGWTTNGTAAFVPAQAAQPKRQQDAA